MKTYLVGGAVRDELLGRPVKDRDWVVVGATEQEMLDLGFSRVGADFPVFLHPETKEEHALARREKKTGKGYKGFESEFGKDVTLTEDLSRRDLTINSMAKTEDGRLFDPFKGRRDLEDGVLRHTTEAFAEDPVRVLRVARFKARYGFTIAPETMELMKKLVLADEMEALTPERVWLELSKALMEDHPVEFFHTLRSCGALERLMPEFKSLTFTGRAMRLMALRGGTLTQRLMPLFSETKDVEKMLRRLSAPADVTQMCVRFQKLLQTISVKLTSESVLKLFKELNVWQQPDKFLSMVPSVLALDYTQHTVQMDALLQAYTATKHVSFKSLPAAEQKSLKGAAIGKAIDEKRAELMEPILDRVVLTLHVGRKEDLL